MQTERFTLQVAAVRDKAIAFTDGTTETFPDPATGHKRTRPRWFFFPKTVTEIEGREEDDWPEVGEIVNVIVPARMAAAKGLM